MTSEMAEQQKPPGNRREDGERVEKPLLVVSWRRSYWHPVFSALKYSQ